MENGDRKSYARLKGVTATLVAVCAAMYVVYSNIMAGHNVEQMSLIQKSAFIFLIATIFTSSQIKCERCKTVWNSSGHSSGEKIVTPVDLFRNVFRMLGELGEPLGYKKCRVCNLERY